MNIKWQFGALIGLGLFLTACAAATSQTPDISPEELAREQAEQKRIIAAEAANPVVKNAQATPQMLERLKKVAKPVYSAGREVCTELKASNCNIVFQLETNEERSSAVNAYTDGKKIVVTPAMMNFAKSDSQLATVLSHEYAHAMMQHPRKTGQNATIGGLLGLAVDTLAGSQGVQTQGMFSRLGTQGAVLRYSQGFEKEADYIGMYILQRSGYSIDDAATLWRRMAALNPDGIYVGSTHPTTAERYILLEKTAEEIKSKKQQERPLLPDFIPES